MTKEKYHHGDLKKELLKKGLQLLNKEGYEDFSLRKVAAMCSVSHAAPYKHFSSKEALIAAIVTEIADSFRLTLEKASQGFNGDCKAQLINLGKQYVKFMMENPDYFKFIFLADHHKPILVEDSAFIVWDGHPFGIAKKCAEKYFASIGMDEKDWTRETLALWSLIHGMAVLKLFNSISYTGDYLELVTRMLEEKLEF